MDTTRFAVDTGELVAVGDRLAGAATAAVRARDEVHGLSGLVDRWSGRRSRQAVGAFLSTLVWAAGGAAAGVVDLGHRAAAAGEAYDRTEQAVPFPR